MWVVDGGTGTKARFDLLLFTVLEIFFSSLSSHFDSITVLESSVSI